MELKNQKVYTARRKNNPKRRKINERRDDMKIIVSASQVDIYVWTVSIAIMVGLICIAIIASLKG
ncbi:MAG: hypothetical protein ACI9TY_000592 [Alphaproteobacteria bacterium]|jgi:hypothetical protein